MPELRQNMATKEWVIIATERAQRPDSFVQPASGRPAPMHYEPSCPFCPGHEEPDLEVLRVPSSVRVPWTHRCVRNKYPALVPDGARARVFDGVHRSMSGVGYHEVLVETRRHDTSPALQTVEEVRGTLKVFQLRGRTYTEDPQVDHVIYFKNHGARAGTSLAHPHAQIMGLPMVPQQVRSRAAQARSYFDDTGQCVLCRMRDDELEVGKRVVAESEHFVAFIPYAAYSPFHMWLVPKRHHASFLGTQPAELDDLGTLLRSVLRKLHHGLNDPDYNYVVRSAPVHEAAFDYMHWYVAVVPRVSQVAGFELGSGMFINTALPEESAAFLRDVEPPRGSVV